MRNAILLLISIVALGFSYAQERPSFIHEQCDHFTVDIQDNLYLWKDAALNKYGPDGQLLFSYLSHDSGNIDNVDANIPSKILVFYKDAGEINILDNTLSPVGNALSLFDHNLFSITLVAFAGANRIALFDNNTHQLILTDFSLNILSTTPVNFGDQFNPTRIEVALDKSIVLIDTTYGLFFFDNFGSYEKKTPLPHVISAQWQGSQLYYLKEDGLYKYDIPALDFILVTKDVQNARDFRRTYKNLYILGPDGEVQRQPIARR